MDRGTSTIEELGRRAVACAWWEWKPGMQTLNHGTVIRRNRSPLVPAGDGLIACSFEWTVPGTDVAALPDLADPATLGALLALVREAWGNKTIVVQDMGGYDGCFDYVVTVGTPARDWKQWPAARTEAEALVVALEAADSWYMGRL